ncbi:MAG TPA: DegT/DnrJ/EryC1/StrS family aminotransferase, partial [Synergistaceae bacterium]|nr:DegT/DnrJ/EryC1/StrS family aminotransferase [Synergistaceae bacterium]
MSTLALLGGTPVRTEKFPGYRVMGQEEKDATARVIDSGVLSGFIAGWHENFWGGPEVRALEEEWAAHFRVKHAIAVNSATSGLMAAVGAVGVEPGDEVIVPPYTMSATAVAPLVWNAVPVFADLEPRGFCLDPVSVEARITPRTRALMAVDIFGHPYDADAINALARKYGLAVIEDCAQAPGATYRGRFAGTLGNLGVFSLNFHKHIHCGEGG